MNKIVYKIKVLLFWLIYFFVFRAVKKVHENDDIFDTVPALAVRQNSDLLSLEHLKHLPSPEYGR